MNMYASESLCQVSAGCLSCGAHVLKCLIKIQAVILVFILRVSFLAKG